MILTGCGSGKLGLTGGSIPIGTSALQGTVVRADNPSIPVESASVTLAKGSQHDDLATDAHGRFDLRDIAGGTLSMSVQASDSEALRPDWRWDLPLPEGAHAQLIVALWPATFDPNSVTAVMVAPPSYTLRVGDTIRFVATAQDLTGEVLSVMPSLLLVGDSALLASNGAVTGAAPGHATLTAWLHGKTAQADITVIP